MTEYSETPFRSLTCDTPRRARKGCSVKLHRSRTPSRCDIIRWDDERTRRLSGVPVRCNSGPGCIAPFRDESICWVRRMAGARFGAISHFATIAAMNSPVPRLRFRQSMRSAKHGDAQTERRAAVSPNFDYGGGYVRLSAGAVK